MVVVVVDVVLVLVLLLLAAAVPPFIASVAARSVSCSTASKPFSLARFTAGSSCRYERGWPGSFGQ